MIYILRQKHIEDLYYTAEVTYESGNNEQSKYSKKASVKGKKFVVSISKLKKNTKVIIKVTKDGYASLKKKYIL